MSWHFLANWSKHNFFFVWSFLFISISLSWLMIWSVYLLLCSQFFQVWTLLSIVEKFNSSFSSYIFFGIFVILTFRMDLLWTDNSDIISVDIALIFVSKKKIVMNKIKIKSDCKNERMKMRSNARIRNFQIHMREYVRVMLSNLILAFFTVCVCR